MSGGITAGALVVAPAPPHIGPDHRRAAPGSERTATRYERGLPVPPPTRRARPPHSHEHNRADDRFDDVSRTRSQKTGPIYCTAAVRHHRSADLSFLLGAAVL